MGIPRDVIEELYRALSVYSRNDPVPRGDCDVEPEEVQTLARVPLRELSVDQLFNFAFHAVTGWGEVAHFKHFLPRLLELAGTPEANDVPTLNADWLGDKLVRAGWSEWPSREREAIGRWWTALWEHALAQPLEAWWSARWVLGGCVRAGCDPRPFLDRWAADGGRDAVRHLASWLSYAERLPEQGLRGDGWDGVADDALAVIERWLREPARREALERARAAAGEDPLIAGALVTWDRWCGAKKR